MGKVPTLVVGGGFPCMLALGIERVPGMGFYVPCIPADLPALLQSLRGCYKLKRLAVSGNPVTQEKQFYTYLMKAVPSLEEVEREAGVAIKGHVTKATSAAGLTEVMMSSNIFMTCLRQIEEQDQLKQAHNELLK